MHASGSVVVLNDVDLSVSPGEMVSVVGPSGSGKSTLLHALAGFVRPYRGSIELLGTDITTASQRRVSQVHREGVGFVFQSYNLVPSLPVIDNVLLPSRFARRDVDKSRAARVLEELGLGARIGQRTSELSGGQQQRVAVARAIYGEPQLVFADEPTGALDSGSGRLVLDALASLTSVGCAVLLVTHDLRAAARADRAVVLRDGCIRRHVVNPSAEILFAETMEADVA